MTVLSMHTIYIPASKPVFSCTFDAADCAGAGAANTVFATHLAGVDVADDLRSPCAYG